MNEVSNENNNKMASSIEIPSTSTTTKPSSSSGGVNSQFKHTILWNGILSNLKSRLIEINSSTQRTHRLRKQHSRFVAAGVGGMLLIKQNMNILSSNNTNSINSNYNQVPRASSSSSMSNDRQNDKLKISNQNSDTQHITFTGSQCVDIVYAYLTAPEQITQFEKKVTREKVTKVRISAKICNSPLVLSLFNLVLALSNNDGEWSV
jgi:hypothetical protein